jgi:unsaturated rhamnogalacturonyl hydrolase
MRALHKGYRATAIARIATFTYSLVQLMRPFRCDTLAIFSSVLWMLVGSCVWAQEATWSQHVANSAIHRWPEGQLVPSSEKRVWSDELGTLLNGMNAVWYGTADSAYYKYIKQAIDMLVTPDGSIPAYDPDTDSLENIAMGRQLLLLYRVTQDAKYYKAAQLLRAQISRQPRNSLGGFWQKQTYPNQMSLHGVYLGEPFYAEYASVFQEQRDFADITRQFSLLDQHSRSPETGLLYDGWDASRNQVAARKSYRKSRMAGVEGMGWYMMALVDSLPYYPQNDPGRATLLAILNRTATSLVRYQNKKTGLWSRDLGKQGQQGNRLELSTACMFVYALQKGVRLGYLPQHYSSSAGLAWQGVLSHFAGTDPSRPVTVTETGRGTRSGGVFDHNESGDKFFIPPVMSNDPKEIAAFLLASTEMELGPGASLAHGKVVMLDAWFNSQRRKNAAGQQEYFHYKWDDYSNSGFSLLGNIFSSYGATLDTLYEAPTLDRLKHAQYYIIASPDILSKNPQPHFMRPEEAAQVAEWVKQGGVLILMENDPANSDISHFDQLADRFGLHFNEVLSHHVIEDHVQSGQIAISGGGSIFHNSHMLYMKDTCTISLNSAATPLVQDKGDILMAANHYGRGTVLAVADPWLYNEYTDGRKVPPEQDNYAAGKEFVRWLLGKAPHDSMPYMNAGEQIAR